MSLTEQVKNILQDELNIEAIDDAAVQGDYPEWDSLTYLRVLAAVESAFGVDITAGNINNFNSVANIVREIEKKR